MWITIADHSPEISDPVFSENHLNIMSANNQIWSVKYLCNKYTYNNTVNSSGIIVLDDILIFFFFFFWEPGKWFTWMVKPYFLRKVKNKYFWILSAAIVPCMLTHCSLESPKRVIGKQCRLGSGTAECGIWSGSPLFANSSVIFL